LVAPVVAVSVDVMAAEDVVVFAHDGDGGGHEDRCGGVGVGAADAEVVQAAAVAESEFAELVDGVLDSCVIVMAMSVRRYPKTTLAPRPGV
jgi:hypothetical protein